MMPQGQPSVPVSSGASAPEQSGPPQPATPGNRRSILTLAATFAFALGACVLAYLVIAVPGHWFAAGPTLAWGPADMQVARGSARIAGSELLVTPADASGLVAVSVNARIRSSDYGAIEWIAADVPNDVKVSLLWRTDYRPGQLNSMPVPTLSGRLLPVTTRGHAAWVGNIQGLALAMSGPIVEPVRIRGVRTRSLSAGELLGDRVGEWLAFEGWAGTSINTINGGADVQELPLPLLLAAAVMLAAAIVAGLRRRKPGAVPMGTYAALMALALGAWLVLDVRWMWNLARQVSVTADRFAGKSWTDKHLAVEDGPLFAFVQKARSVMPATPERVIVAADSDYFRGRAAYHLYPHNVFFYARANTLPPPEQFRPGSWFLVYHRAGIQFDAARGLLRWDNLAPVKAELKLAGPGAALFQIR